MCSFFKRRCFWFDLNQTNRRTVKTGVDQEMVKEAGNELRQAYQILSQAEEEEMVDYAVFTVKAAEKRYSYLLKKFREQEKEDLCWQKEAGSKWQQQT